MRISTIGLIVLLVFSLFAVPAPAIAQEHGKVYRIGWLGGQRGKGYFKPFLDQLRALGWVEGQNFVMVYELVPFSQLTKQAPALAAKLIQRNVDIIVTVGVPATLAAKEATATIPIVFSPASRPVERGIVKSLARPGGNVTGLAYSAGDEMHGKMLQMFQEAIPTISRVAVLFNPEETSPDAIRESHERMTNNWQTRSQKLGLSTFVTFVKDVSEYADAFATIKQRADAMVVLPTAMNVENRNNILDFALKNQVPTMCTTFWWAKGGCLLAYWNSHTERRRRTAFFVDKILKGANPGDLPVVRPWKLELKVNLKTAKALGITIPPTVLFQADKVIR